MKKHILRAPATDRYLLEVPSSYDDLTDLPVIPPEYVPPSVLSSIYHNSLGGTFEAAGSEVIDFDRDEYDPGGYVTTGSGWIFTVPADNTGIYLLTAFAEIEFALANVDCDVAVLCKVNGSEVARSTYTHTHAGGGLLTLALTLVRYLTAGDTVAFAIENNNADSTSVTLTGDDTKNGVSITRLR
jgi:hypothetical protein